MSGGPGSYNKTMKKEREAERFNVYLQWIRRGKFHSEACRLAKVKPQAVRLRQQTDPQFAQDLQEAHQEFAEQVESVLTDAAFGVVHYAVDKNDNPVYDKNGNPVPAQRDTKAALEWLKARNSSIFNPARQVNVNVQQTHTLDFTEIHTLRAQLEARRPAELAPGDLDIVDAEVLDDEG